MEEFIGWGFVLIAIGVAAGIVGRGWPHFITINVHKHYHGVDKED